MNVDQARPVMSGRLQPRRLEGVASSRIAALHAAAEPAHALLGRAMGEGLRRHDSARLPLQAVVAHPGRRRQRFLGVARLQHLACPLRVVCPLIVRLSASF